MALATLLRTRIPHVCWIFFISLFTVAAQQLTVGEPESGDLSANDYWVLKAIHLNGIHGVVSSPDGKWIATFGIGSTIKIWDATTGHGWFKIHSEKPLRVQTVAFTADSSEVACIVNGRVSFWDIGKKKRVPHFFDDHRGYVMSFGFRPDGNSIVTVEADAPPDRNADAKLAIRVWDARSGKRMASVPTGLGWTEALVLTPDCKAFAAWDESIHVLYSWDTITFAKDVVLRNNKQSVVPVAYSPDGAKLLLLNGYELSVFAKSTAKNRWSEHALSAKLRTRETRVAFCPDGKTLASVNENNVIEIIAVDKGEVLRTIRGDKSVIAALSYSRDGAKLISVSGGQERSPNRVIVWDAKTGTPEVRLRDWTPLPIYLGFHGGKNTLSIRSIDMAAPWSAGRILLWDYQSGKITRSLEGFPWATEGLFLSDARVVEKSEFPSSSKVIDCLSMKDTAKRTSRRLAASNEILGIVASPDQKMIAWWTRRNSWAENSGTVSVWGLEADRLLWSLERQDLSWLSFSADEKKIAAVDRHGDKVTLWEAASGKLCWQRAAKTPIREAAFSGDGTELALIARDAIKDSALEPDTSATITVWDVATGKEKREAVPILAARPALFQFSKKTNAMVCVFTSGIIELWDPIGMRRTARYVGKTDVHYATMSQDGGMIAYATITGEVVVQDLATGQQIGAIDLNDRFREFTKN